MSNRNSEPTFTVTISRNTPEFGLEIQTITSLSVVLAAVVARIENENGCSAVITYEI